MQKRKKCIPEQSRKGRVDKARLRETKPHVSKYKSEAEKGMRKDRKYRNKENNK